MEIKFWYGGGFAGESYIMQVNDKYYQLCTNLGGEIGNKEAVEIAKQKLSELNIDFKDDIVFKWNGTM